MWGNGVKRKLGEEQDGFAAEEEVAVCDYKGFLGGAPGLVAAGGPRPGFSSMASYVLQRQTVLNISLVKLYRPREGRGDPGLQRRILISNVIRRIHDDLRREGGLGALFLAVPPAGSVGREDHRPSPPPPTPPPSPTTSFNLLSVPLPGLETCLTPASLLEEDLFFAPPPSPSSPPHPNLPQHPPPQPAPSLSPSPPPKDSFSTALEEIEELGSSDPSALSRAPARTSAAGLIARERGLQVDEDEEEGELKKREEESKATEHYPSPLSASQPSATTVPQHSGVPTGGFLTDFALDDVLFTDIDTSMYDFTPCTPPTGVGAGVGTGPTKTVADDLVVRAISGYGSGGSSHPNQPFRMDLAELDHIMEVLVGS